MTMKPVRAFAPVRDGVIAQSCIQPMAYLARREMGMIYQPYNMNAGWQDAHKDGWRIRPVLVTLEIEEPTHDQ